MASRVLKPRVRRFKGTAGALVVCTGQRQFRLGYKLGGKVARGLRVSSVITHHYMPRLGLRSSSTPLRDAYDELNGLCTRLSNGSVGH